MFPQVEYKDLVDFLHPKISYFEYPNSFSLGTSKVRSLSGKKVEIID
jgi:hypothetical protein